MCNITCIILSMIFEVPCLVYMLHDVCVCVCMCVRAHARTHTRTFLTMNNFSFVFKCMYRYSRLFIVIIGFSCVTFIKARIGSFFYTAYTK